MDAEEFQAWKDSQSTQWVLLRVAQKSAELQERTMLRLFNSTGMTAAEWSDLQGQSGYDRGVAAGINYVVGLEFEEIDEATAAAQV